MKGPSRKENKAIELAEDAIRSAKSSGNICKELVAVNKRLIQMIEEAESRLGDASEIIKNLLVYVDAIVEHADQLEKLEEAAGGPDEFRRLQDQAREYLVHRRQMDSINAQKAVLHEEIESAKNLYDELIESFPTKTACFREIAARMDKKVDQVRYLIEGPRRSKQ